MIGKKKEQTAAEAKPSAAKKSVKRREPAAEQMPTLVDNPMLAKCKTLLEFNAGKARAVTNYMNATAAKSYARALASVCLAAAQGESEIYLNERTDVMTIDSLRMGGFRVEREEVKDSWPLSMFNKPYVLHKVTW